MGNTIAEIMRSFASDNTAPAAPEILQAIVDANDGDAPPYGDDRWTAAAIARLREKFGVSADVYSRSTAPLPTSSHSPCCSGRGK